MPHITTKPRDHMFIFRYWGDLGECSVSHLILYFKGINDPGRKEILQIINIKFRTSFRPIQLY
jgi:hypothetical protein